MRSAGGDRIGTFVVAACLAWLACNGQPDAGASRPDGGAVVSPDSGPPYVLDVAHPTVVRPIGSEAADLAPQKFVEVVVSRIVNRRRRGLVFDVSYRGKAGDEARLGQFAPFPPDRPGTFIVPTRGLLRHEGSIVVTLVPVDRIEAGDSVRVEIAAIRLRRE